MTLAPVVKRALSRTRRFRSGVGRTRVASRSTVLATLATASGAGTTAAPADMRDSRREPDRHRIRRRSADPLRGRHRHRGPLPAAHRVEDVLRVLDGVRRRGPEHALLPGLPRPARARCRSSTGGPSSSSSLTGLAIEATTPEATRWDRKNYFYPDLPKGYQISQYDLPLASAGRLAVETSDGPVTIGITRAHLEEDTAKLVHATDADGRKVSLVDFNRSGAPLMEIVTDPDIRTAEAGPPLRRGAAAAAAHDRRVSDADMERGQMRVEANVSLRPRGTEPFGTRVEVKNMNSFRSVERAIDYEIARQAAALDAGETAPPGDPRLVRRPRRDVPHALQGDVGRLSLLPGAGPAAAPRRARLARRAARVAAGAARRAPGALPGRGRAVGLRRGACWPARPEPTALFEATRAADPALPAKAVANWVTGEYLRLRKSASDGRAR